MLSNNKALFMSPAQLHCIGRRMTLPIASSGEHSTFTVEPPNNGHFGDTRILSVVQRLCVFCRDWFSEWRLWKSVGFPDAATKTEG